MWNFLSVFLVILQKKFFWLQPIFGPSWWVLAKKIFFRIFIWKKHAKWYQWKKYSGIFLASVCPKEYKNGKIFDRQFFGPQEAISLTVIYNRYFYISNVKIVLFFCQRKIHFYTSRDIISFLTVCYNRVLVETNRGVGWGAQSAKWAGYGSTAFYSTMTWTITKGMQKDETTTL